MMGNPARAALPVSYGLGANEGGPLISAEPSQVTARSVRGGR